MRPKIIAGLLVLALVATAIGVVLAQDRLGQPPEGIGAPEGNRSPIIAPRWSDEECEMDQLTEEEREEVKQQMQEFWQELRDQHSDNLTEEERKAMDQELQNFWAQICDQYNISCPIGYRYWAVEGGGINGSVGPERQMNEHRPRAGEEGGDVTENTGQERQGGENGLGLVTRWLGNIQTFFRNLIGLKAYLNSAGLLESQIGKVGVTK
jgi:hypothetical protein